MGQQFCEHHIFDLRLALQDVARPKTLPSFLQCISAGFWIPAVRMGRQVGIRTALARFCRKRTAYRGRAVNSWHICLHSQDG